MALRLSGEVDVALKRVDGTSSLHGLSHTSGKREGVGARGTRHVDILALQSFSVNGGGHLLGVVTLWNAFFKFIVSVLLGTVPHTCLNNQLIVTLFHGHAGAVLGGHHLFTNGVGSQIFFDVFRSLPGLESPGLTLGLLSSSLGIKFSLNLSANSSLQILGLETNSGDLVSGVLSSAPVGAGWVPVSIQLFSVDSRVGVIEDLISDNGVLKIVVALGNVLTHDGSVACSVSN